MKGEILAALTAGADRPLVRALAADGEGNILEEILFNS